VPKQELVLKNKSLRQLIRYYYSDDISYQHLSDDAYLEILRRHMSDLPEGEIRFFVNRKRFRLMRALIGDQLENEVTSILNVASGPFAFENYAHYRSDAQIDSFDMNPDLQGVYEDLQKTAAFSNVKFECKSAETFHTSKQYDLVLINDLFYYHAVDFDLLIESFVDRLKPNGILYFDILDKRSERLWQFFGKDSQFVRYDLEKISEKLRSLGLEIESVTPALGIGGIVDFTMRSALYRTLRLANNFVFVSRKKEPGG